MFKADRRIFLQSAAMVPAPWPPRNNFGIVEKDVADFGRKRMVIVATPT